MGLLEKLKNTFFEEEYVELDDDYEDRKVASKIEEKKVKEEPIKEEVKEEIKPIVLDEEEETETLEEEPEVFSDRDLVNKNSKLTYFEDEDFEPAPVKKEEPKRIYGESSDKLYSSINIDDLDKYNMPNHKAYGAKENTFEPTPIISPIYGILDKNYRKEEVVDKKDRLSSYVSRKDVDLDSVRKKAYGDYSILSQLDETTEEEDKALEEALLYDTSIDDKPVVDQVTVADAEEYFNDLGLEYNVDYKDAHYENATGRRSELHKDEEESAEVEEELPDEYKIDEEEDDTTLDDIINKQEDVEDDEANLEDNLFDLVDSIYEDGE